MAGFNKNAMSTESKSPWPEILDGVENCAGYFYELLIGLMWGIVFCLACFNLSFALSTLRFNDAMYACFGLSGLIGLIDLNS